jgi:hypothetical protein
MPETLNLEVPDFDQVRLEAGPTTATAMQLLWSVISAEATSTRARVQRTKDTIRGKAIVHTPAAAMHNFDTEAATVVHFNGSSAYDLTGFRNGASGRVFWVHNTGSGTQTVKHQNTGSVTTNRIVTQSGSDVSLTTGKSVGFIYLDSRWREVKDA